MTTLAPITGHEDSVDPRDPLLRLTNFFDEGSLSLLHPRDKSGVQAAIGEVNGVRTVSYCTDGTVMGGAMGVVGCAHIVNAIDTAITEQAPVVGIWHSGGARLAEGVEACTPSAESSRRWCGPPATSRRSRWSSDSPPAAPPTDPHSPTW